MKAILIVLFFIASYVLGATMHERDMYNSLKETGDASAWFFEIVSEEMIDGN